MTRNKIVIAFLFIPLAFMWLLGWTLFYVGKTRTEATSVNERKEPEIEVTTLIDEILI